MQAQLITLTGVSQPPAPSGKYSDTPAMSDPSSSLKKPPKPATASPSDVHGSFFEDLPWLGPRKQHGSKGGGKQQQQSAAALAKNASAKSAPPEKSTTDDDSVAPSASAEDSTNADSSVKAKIPAAPLSGSRPVSGDPKPKPSSDDAATSSHQSGNNIPPSQASPSPPQGTSPESDTPYARAMQEANKEGAEECARRSRELTKVRWRLGA